MTTIETSPATRNRLLYVIAPVLWTGVAADQVSKSWASSAATEPHVLVSGYLGAYAVQNAGAILGFSRDQAWTSTVFAVLGIASAGMLGLAACRDRQTWRMADCLAGALLLAGICGNTVDRIALGHVRDFLVTWAIPTLIFNLADLFVIVGIATLLAARYSSLTRRQALGGLLRSSFARPRRSGLIA
jgi:lipoprotein signal peptidase